MNEIDKFRKQIDNIDEKILDLLNMRGEIVKKIGLYKKNNNIEIYQPARENEVIDKLKSLTKVLKPNNIESIWKEIMGACKVLEGSIFKVGYLGPQGSFTYQAALDFFPKAGTDFIPCKSIVEIFENIEKDTLEFGVVPIENSLQGTVRETLDLLIEKNLIIYGEIEIRIVLNLISLTNSNLSKIKTIYSHPQAFAQARMWLKTNVPTAKLINIDSTSEAVKKVKDSNDVTFGAIGTEFACKLHDLSILSSNIEDNPSNFTRFLIISKRKNEIRGERIKTSIVYVVKHVPGALYSVLKPFSDANINLTKIESRPRRRGKWEYIFLMDFEGDKDTPEIQEVIEHMTHNVIWFKILGTYPY